MLLQLNEVIFIVQWQHISNCKVFLAALFLVLLLNGVGACLSLTGCEHLLELTSYLLVLLWMLRRVLLLAARCRPLSTCWLPWLVVRRLLVVFDEVLLEIEWAFRFKFVFPIRVAGAHRRPRNPFSSLHG